MAESGLDGQIKKVRTFKSELLEAKKAYENLVLTKAPTEEIAAAAAKVAELKDEADDANSAVTALTGAGRFQAVTKSIQAVAGGFTAVQGAIGLAGGATEDFQKTIQKVQSAMALTQGLTALEDVGDSFKNLKTVAVDTFKSIGPMATKVFATMRANLIATGIGAFVVLLGTLIANFESVGKVVDKIIPGFSKFAETVMKGVTAITDFLGLTDSLAEKDKKATEARDKNIKGIENQIKVAKAEGDQKKVLALEEQEILMKLAQARQDYAAAVRNEDAKARKEAGQRIIDLKNELKVKDIEQTKYEEEQKKKGSEAAQKKADEAEERRKKEAEKEKAFQDKRRDLLRNNALAELTDERQIAEKKQQFAYEDRLAEINALEVAEEKKKELRLLAETENRNALSKIKKDFDEKDKKEEEQKAQELKKFLADTEKEKLALQIEELTKQKEELLKNDKLTDEQRLEIEKQYLAEKEKLNKESADRIAQEELDSAQKLADEKLLKDKLRIAKSLADGTTTIKKAREEERQIELKSLEDKLALAKKYGKGVEEAELALLAFKKSVRDEDKANATEALNAGLDAATTLGNDIMALQEARTQKLLADETLTAEEREKIAKEQFENAKKMQYALAIIDGAKAITAILSVPDFTLGVASAIRIASAAASTGFALAKISQTQFQPTTSKAGSKFQEGGLLSGASHEQGGIRNYFGEMEGGEFVVNKQSSAAFLPLLERINDMGNNQQIQSQPVTASYMEPPVIKTYVVASDMTSQQEANKRIADIASL